MSYVFEITEIFQSTYSINRINKELLMEEGKLNQRTGQHILSENISNKTQFWLSS